MNTDKNTEVVVKEKHDKKKYYDAKQKPKMPEMSKEQLLAKSVAKSFVKKLTKKYELKPSVPTAPKIGVPTYDNKIVKSQNSDTP